MKKSNHKSCHELEIRTRPRTSSASVDAIDVRGRVVRFDRDEILPDVMGIMDIRLWARYVLRRQMYEDAERFYPDE